MSCRESRAGSALTTFARLQSGLSDVQTLSAFHALRADAPAGMRAPGELEWRDFLSARCAAVEANTDLSDARRRSLLTRLSSAMTEPIPDGRTYYALRNIESRTARQGAALESRLSQAAAATNTDVATLRARYQALQDATPRTRRGAAPDGYTDQLGINAAAADLPTDRASVMALRQIEADVLATRVERARSGLQRIQRASTGSVYGITEMGYDPDGGRLEVVLANSDQVHSYRAVPQDVWERLQGSSSGQVAHNVWAHNVRGNSNYRYGTPEDAVLDGAARQCSDCGQFAASSHRCPQRVARDQAAARAEVAAQAAQDAVTLANRASVDAFAAAAAADADLRARTAETRPAAVGAIGLGMWNSGYYPNDLSNHSVGRYDSMSMPPVRELRAHTRNQPVDMPFTYAAGHRSAEDRGIPAGGNWRVTGRLVADRPARGQYLMVGRNLQCSCDMYAEHGNCPHLNYAIERARSVFVPSTVAPRVQDTASAQAAAEAALAADWTRNQDLAAEAAATWAPSAPEDSYSTNFAAFEDDYNAALARRDAGDPPIPYVRSNALGGGFTRESGKGFGVELEFDFAPGVDRYAALHAIGQELYSAGLTRSSRQQHYHASKAYGYVDQHARGWSFERDQTVAGEIVSPVMFDEPETWDNIEKVCEIVARHGGKASVRTGSHVHVSSPNTSPRTATELVRMANQHEDVMYRISQDPKRGKHRSLKWCGPNQDVAPAGYATTSDASRRNHSHHIGVNLQSVSMSNKDHPEIRHWDGTLDPAVIQTQIKVSAAMVEAATRNSVAAPSPARGREAVGSHAVRKRALLGRSRRALTSEELAADTATARSFADTLFTRREDKAQFAALFAITKWHTVRA